MLRLSLPAATSSRCTLTHEPANACIHATWQGFVTEAEALRGARHYLVRLACLPCQGLLNDTLALRGSQFDSIAWLQQAWLPHALRLGLRYVAHVVQSDADLDTKALSEPGCLPGPLEFQIFHTLAEAGDWLRTRQPPA